MRTLDDIARLLALLREAGDEPVSLDELEIVGVVDPATALHALELAGHAVQRVLETRPDREIVCVRLAGDLQARQRGPAGGRHGRKRGTHPGTARR